MSDGRDARVDGITLEIYRHRLAAIAEEMGEVLTLAGFSPNIKERRDHSCALFDAAGDMIAQAAHIPVHLGAAPLCVKAVIDHLDLADGSTAIVNDPFAGGTHLPDITLVTAVDLDGHRFFVATRAHHADVGGISPGSLPLSRTIDDEGWRCPPTLLNDAVVAELTDASRTPDERRGDLAAQRAANRVGVTRLRELAAERGADTVAAMSGALQDYSERLTRAWAAALPRGTWSAEDALDDADGGGVPVGIRLTLGVDDSGLTFDFMASDDQVEGPMNSVRAIVESAVFYALSCLVPDAPPNGGVLRPVRILTRSGSVVDARYPAAVAAGNVETSQRLVDVVLRALAAILPDEIPASSYGSMNNVLIGSLPGAARPFVYYETLGGGHGGGPVAPGASGMQAHMTNTLNTPVEALEHAFPMRVLRYRLRDGSGGVGRNPGGEGLEREYEFLEPVEVTLVAERRRRGAPGLGGGEAGAVGEQARVDVSGREIALPGKFTAHFDAGERFVVRTPGGGGWGAPER